MLAAAGAVAGVVGGSSTPRPPSAATPAVDTKGTAAAAAAAWLRTELPSTATVAGADEAVIAALTARGIVVTGPASIDSASPGSFVVSVSGSGSISAALGGTRTAVPVARFTDGPTALVVDQVVGSAPAQVATERRATQTTARSAASGLLRNPAVTVTPAARPVFAAGRLDLRAATFVAVLAGTQAVRVLAAPSDGAEDAAGLPVRRLVLTLADATALPTVVDATRAPYAPTVSTPDAGYPAGSVLLTWSVRADPTPES